MCIRDRRTTDSTELKDQLIQREAELEDLKFQFAARGGVPACLLYTSDAADERSSVDLGGRRIIKKKKDENDH